MWVTSIEQAPAYNPFVNLSLLFSFSHVSGLAWDELFGSDSSQISVGVQKIKKRESTSVNIIRFWCYIIRFWCSHLVDSLATLRGNSYPQLGNNSKKEIHDHAPEII